MKKVLFTILITFLTAGSFLTAETVYVQDTNSLINLVSSNDQSVIIEYTVGSFEKNPVTIKGEPYYRIGLRGEGNIIEAGYPELPKITRSIIIPDNAKVEVHVNAGDYVEYRIPVAPSKGTFSRNADPSEIPYTFSDIYSGDSFYPESSGELGTPYIMRDFRGITVTAYPFVYNPDTEILRVYTQLTVEIKTSGIDDVNVKNRKMDGYNKYFKELYSGHFINFENSRYETVYEKGSIIVISYGGFMDAMRPYVDWKNQKGIRCDLYDVAEMGSNADGIKNFIQAEYDVREDLVFVQLVGDNAQIPTFSYAGGGADPSYSLLEGIDTYPELFVGRFSAENNSHVETQVERTINYERDIVDGDWLHKGIGIASNQGPGDDGETDDAHQDMIRQKLMDFTYTHVDQIYDPSGTVSQAVTAINEGRGIINYTGHGSETCWGNGAALCNGDVNNLTNDYMLPFVSSVACVNGAYESTTCFAETWLRATNNSTGAPTGAIAHYASTINQYWSEPMRGQDHAVDLLVGWDYSTNQPLEQKNSLGGLWYNGSCNMMDNYGQSGIDMFMTWIIFGDASLQVRTDVPSDINVSHTGTLFIGADTYDVSIGEPDILVALSEEGVLLGSGFTDASGIVTIELESAPSAPTELTLTASGFNKITTVDPVTVIAPEGPYVAFDSYLVNDINGNNDGTVDFGETVGMYLTVSNVGVDDAYNVTAAISSQDQLVTITDNSVSFGNIAPDEMVESSDDFVFDVSNATEDGHIILFEVQVTGYDNNNNELVWNANFTVVVEAPFLEFEGYALNGTGNNGTFDPGETVEIAVTIVNNGAEAGTDVQATLTDNSSYIIIDDGQSDFYTVPGSGGSSSNIYNPFVVTANADMPLGSEIEFALNISAQNGYSASATFSLIVGQNQFFSEDVPMDFGPNNIESNLEIPVNMTISDIDVMVDITHTWDGDVELKLQSPFGTTINLVTGVGGSGSDFDNTIFDDDATIPIGQGSPPFNGSYQPEQPLAAFSGEESGGIWTLLVSDNYPSLDDGTLNNWSLTISGESSELCMPGDVNSDSFIDIFDIVQIVNIVLEINSDPTDVQLCAADFDGDGEILIFDIVQIVNYILGNGRIESASVEEAKLLIKGNDLSLKADGPVAGIQFKIKTTSEIDFFEIPGMEIVNNRIDEITQVVMFSTNGSSVSNCDILKVHDEFTIEDVYVSDLQGNRIDFRVVMVPEVVSLDQNYPNPFNPVTSIQFHLPEESKVELTVFDLLGHEVTKLVDQQITSGSHKIEWNSAGTASGIYIYRLKTGNEVITKKMILLK